MRDFGTAIQSTLLDLRLSQPLWEHRGDPCGLLLDVDEPTGYESEPMQFRPFCSWGVDGVHDGLWIDDIRQPHPPFFVLFSPMDFDQSVRLLASSIEEWLAIAADSSFEDEIHQVAENEAIKLRQELDLPHVTTPDSLDGFSVDE